MVTKNDLQSLLGLLLYITKCVKLARYFLNRMLQLLRDNTDNHRVLLTEECLKWFQIFLRLLQTLLFKMVSGFSQTLTDSAVRKHL